MKKLLIVAMVALALTCIVFAKGKTKYTKSIPLGSEKSVMVKMELELARLNLTKGDAKNLLTAEVFYNTDKIQPNIEYSDGSTAYLKIETKKVGEFSLKHWDNNENEWNLTLSDKVPMEMEISLGLGEGELDFTGMQIEDLEVKGGLSEMNLKFDRPNIKEIERLKIESGLGEVVAKGLLNANFRKLSYEGGLGSSELYFTGESKNPAEAKIQVGLGSIEIYLKEGLPVKVYCESSFLSSIDVEGFSKVRKGEWESPNWREDAPNRLELSIEVGMGSVSVQWE
jgi:hypothetical protein